MNKFVLIYTRISLLHYSYCKLWFFIYSLALKYHFLFIHIYAGDTIAKQNIEKSNSDASAIDKGKIYIRVM